MGRSWWLVCVLAVTPPLAGCPFSQSTPLPPLTSIAAGAGHSLALDEAGNAWAWGYNLYGQLGDGSVTSGSTTPVQVQMPAGVRFVSVRGGLNESLALDRDGKVWAWGYDHAVLDPNDSPVRNTPAPVDMPDGVSFTHVSGDSGYVLALDLDSSTWESTAGGEGGSASSGFTLVDLPAGVTATIISARGHSLVLDQDGNAWAWRDNMFGQLGDGSRFSRSTPERVGAP